MFAIISCIYSPTFAITAAHCFFEPNDVMAKDCEGKGSKEKS